MSTSKTTTIASFFTGFAVAATLFTLLADRKKKKNRKNAGASVEGSDASLFWGNEETLTQVPKKNKFLPTEIYGKMVQDCVVCCVDCLVVRYNPSTKRKECLLVERATEPAKGIWWLPGGRLFKGETFFDGAVRKAKEEFNGDVDPVQVLGFYNTFFPTSAWDTETTAGTQTVQPIVLVKMKKGAEIKLDATSERYRWIGLSSKEAVANGEDKYVVDALLKLEAWNSTYYK